MRIFALLNNRSLASLTKSVGVLTARVLFSGEKRSPLEHEYL